MHGQVEYYPDGTVKSIKNGEADPLPEAEQPLRVTALFELEAKYRTAVYDQIAYAYNEPDTAQGGTSTPPAPDLDTTTTPDLDTNVVTARLISPPTNKAMIDALTAYFEAGNAVLVYESTGKVVLEKGEEEEEFGPAPDYPFFYANVCETAFNYYGLNTTPSLTQLTEAQKEQIFLNGSWEQITGILLYEFATNTGWSVRTFYETSPYTQAIKQTAALEDVIAQFVKEYNKADSNVLRCDADNNYKMRVKYNISPSFNPFTWIPSIAKHIQAFTTINNQITFTRGGMKFDITYIPGSTDLKIVMLDGYSLQSLGLHVLKSRDRMECATFGNTDIYVEFTVPKPSNMINRP